jgi:hypothetical protein
MLGIHLLKCFGKEAKELEIYNLGGNDRRTLNDLGICSDFHCLQSVEICTLAVSFIISQQIMSPKPSVVITYLMLKYYCSKGF